MSENFQRATNIIAGMPSAMAIEFELQRAQVHALLAIAEQLEALRQLSKKEIEQLETERLDSEDNTRQEHRNRIIKQSPLPEFIDSLSLRTRTRNTIWRALHNPYCGPDEIAEMSIEEFIHEAHQENSLLLTCRNFGWGTLTELRYVLKQATGGSAHE